MELLDKCRSRFRYFIPFIDEDYKFYPVHEYLVSVLEQFLAKEIKYLAISMPPRHGKSRLVSELLISYYLGLNPANRVILASYGQSLSTELGANTRRIMDSDEYKLLFPNSLISGNSKASGSWRTVKHGKYLAVGRGGGITGLGANLLVADDLLKNSLEATSTTILEYCQQWFDSTFASRLLPGGQILLLMTRWSKRDIIGYTQEKEPHKWTYINIPALCEDEANDLLGRKLDEPLIPDWFTFDHLDGLRRRNPYQFSALYQGNPVAKEGNLMRLEYIHRYTQLPARFSNVILSADTASKALTDNDYTAVTVWGIDSSNNAYLIFNEHRKLEMPALIDWMVELSDTWMPNKILIEDASSGIALIQILREQLSNVEAISPKGNAMLKLNQCVPMFQQGRLLFPQTGAEDCVDELAAYPYGDHDDFVTSVRQFGLWFMENTGLAGSVALTSNKSGLITSVRKRNGYKLS